MAPNLKMMGVTLGLALFCNTFLDRENDRAALVVAPMKHEAEDD